MEFYNRYSHHDNRIAASRFAKCLKLTYIKDLDVGREVAEKSKGNMFLATDAAGNKRILAMNLYPNSFENGKFKWIKPWQGLAMPDGMFNDSYSINMFAQVDGNDELIAFAPAENFNNEAEECNGVKSRIAKEFYVVNATTREMWHVNVARWIYEKIK